MSGIRVTVEDLETGETNSAEIWNDYIVITAGDRYVDGKSIYANGTAVITIKRDPKLTESESRGASE